MNSGRPPQPAVGAVGRHSIVAGDMKWQPRGVTAAHRHGPAPASLLLQQRHSVPHEHAINVAAGARQQQRRQAVLGQVRDGLRADVRCLRALLALRTARDLFGTACLGY